MSWRPGTILMHRGLGIIGKDHFEGDNTIKKSVYTAIREINETLSLTNEPGQLINMSLDTLSQVLEVDCCWIQTIEGMRRARLAAERGLTSEMQAELVSMDMAHRFNREIIGLGHHVLIPDLSTDGAYGLEPFRKAGFKWLLAVPLMTYRVHGILGIASRNKKHLKKETPELTMLVGGLIGTALNKYRLFQKSTKAEKMKPERIEEPEKVPKASNAEPQLDKASDPVPEPQQEEHPSVREEKPFDAHSRRMKRFRGFHESS